MDAVVRSMLMAGGDDVLRQVGRGRSKAPCGSVRIRVPLGRSDLESRVAHPFHFNRRRSNSRNPQKSALYNSVRDRAEDAGRESQRQNQKREVLRS